MKFLKPEEFVDVLNQIFATLKSRILQVLPQGEVDHIGSSAIKGAISKGDLDILVRVRSDEMAEAIKAIESLGFKIKEGTLRTESLCMLVTAEFNEDVAIQLIAQGSEFEDFLLFRDKLNSNPDLVMQYNQLKLKSTNLTPDEYRIKKSEFIQKILSKD